VPWQPEPLLDGARAVVTGGANGIGRAVCLAFAGHGAEVVAVDIDEANLGGTVVTAESSRGSVTALHGDVTDPDLASRVASTIEPDILVNNVGHYLRPKMEFAESSEQDWESLRAINLSHVLYMTRALLPGMITRGRGGSIVNVTTVETMRGIPGQTVYSAYKSAVGQFTKSLAVEVGRHGIRANAVAPDLIETPQIPYSVWVPPEQRWRWATWAPLGRHGTPDDVAGAVLFFASPWSSFITGTTLNVDGGSIAAGGWFPRGRGGWTNRPMIDG
jgi:NAD(P)-dependent dehydrogenase (short-subunit alcohol dehydrogenase family)